MKQFYEKLKIIPPFPLFVSLGHEISCTTTSSIFEDASQQLTINKVGWLIKNQK